MISFQRTYKNLSTHVSVAFSINISYFGSKTTVPTGQSIVNFIFDGNTVAGPRIATADACSDSTSPTILLTNFQGVVAHSSSSLTLVIQALFPFQQIQVGLREVALLFYTTAPTFSVSQDSPICQASISTNAFEYDECSCPLGQYYFLSCTACAFQCSTCFKIGSYCYTCVDGNFWTGTSCFPTPPCCSSYSGGSCSSCKSGCFSYGNGVCQAACDPDIGYYPVQILSTLYCFQKCPNSSPIRYLNGSCLTSCTSPLTHLSTSVNGVSLDYCYNPCSSYQYINPDGSCTSACSSPLTPTTIGTIRFCQSPCSDPIQFYSAATHSCVNSCPSPLQTSNVTGVPYCSSPCYGSQYLYLNGSCLSTCPLPLKTSSEQIATYCLNPCSGNDYLYANGSCINTCPSPFVSRQEPGVKYCDNPCPTPGYFYSNGSCLSTCPEPLTTQLESPLTLCLNPCTGEDFLFPNRSCINNCPSPLVSRQEPAAKYCFNPCQPSDYLYPNESCFHNCPSPLLSRQEPGVQYCFNPCQTSEFYYSNGSCLSACTAPLISQLESMPMFCINPCTEGDYLYQNGSCFKSCPTPLISRQEPGVQYCFNPCQPSDFLYSNGSCLNSCQSPFAPRTEPDVNYCSLICDGYLTSDGVCLPECNPPLKKRIQQDTATAYCDSPCSNPSDYYYPDDGSCQSQCGYPNRIIKENILLQTCTLKVTEAQVEQAKKLAKTTETTDSIASGGIVIGSLLSSSDSTSAAMGSLAKMLAYIKFMNINFPPKLQLLFNSQTSNSSLLSSIPNHLRNRISNEPPPSNFGKYNLSSSFLVNFWQSLVILGAILIIILILLIFSVLTKRCTSVSGLIQKILSALKWNTFFTLFCSYCGDIVLFSALEFQTAQYENFWSAVSLTLCTLINILMGYTLYKILIVNFSVRKTQQDKTAEEISKDFEDYKALFECYKEDSYFQQIFLFVFMIRMSLFDGIIGYLFPYPLIQAIMILLVNASVLVYLIFKRPMRKLINLIQQILLEGIILIFNIGVIILAILDAKKQEAESAREKIGDMMMIINVIAPILSMILIAIKIGLTIWELYKNYKKSKTPSNQKLSDIISIQQARAASGYPGFQPKERIPHPKNQLMTMNQTNQNLLYPSYNNNNSLFSEESKQKNETSFYEFFRYGFFVLFADPSKKSRYFLSEQHSQYFYS